MVEKPASLTSMPPPRDSNRNVRDGCGLPSVATFYQYIFLRRLDQQNSLKQFHALLYVRSESLSGARKAYVNVNEGNATTHGC